MYNNRSQLTENNLVFFVKAHVSSTRTGPYLKTQSPFGFIASQPPSLQAMSYQL
jgi:hypothetical protein